MLSKDTDLARFEPGLFGNWFIKSQQVCGGAGGIVAGTQFTAGGVDFNLSKVAAGDVIWLKSTDAAIEGAYEIASVIDGTHLAVTILRSADQQALLPIASASGLTWRIVKYQPQCYEAMRQITARLALRPGAAGAQYGIEDVTNPDALLHASVFCTLAILFETLYGGTDDQEIFKEKAATYQKMFRQAIERASVLIDTGGDGLAELQLRAGEIVLRRI